MPASLQAASPLGPSYVLVPLPGDDDSLLGRVLLAPPEQGRSLDEISRPNECADKLDPRRASALASTFEDAQSLAVGGQARAALATFGFEADAQTATHFYYKLEVSRRLSQTDTPAYVACCKDRGTCGYGYVSALVYGHGQYATASESSGHGSITLPVAGGAGGSIAAQVLHKRDVAGYVAAVVTVTDPAAARALSVLGDPKAAGITIDEQSLPQQIRERYEAQRVQVQQTDGDRIEVAYQFVDGSGPITENEFTRRYEDVTGSGELSPARSMRRKGLVFGGLATMMGGAALITVGVLNVNSPCDHTSAECPFGLTQNPGWVYDPVQHNYYDPNGTVTNTLGVLGIIGGGMLAAAGATVFGLGIAHDDGAPTEHSISRFDAEIYVTRYNHALLRRVVQEAETRLREGAPPASVSVMPLVTPGFVGVAGTF